jgi:hypothetical protein
VLTDEERQRPGADQCPAVPLSVLASGKTA